MNRNARVIAVLLCIAGIFSGFPAGATNIINTKHNLSSSGPGDIKAQTETRICVFCHTPHNASPQTPLWNKNIEGLNYTLYPPYTSSTMVSQPGGPTGPSRLCLSCHDGTIALGDVLRPSSGIAMNVPGAIPAGRSSNFGTSLENHHPVSFSYFDALPNMELSPAPPFQLQFYNGSDIQCTTCHDPHDNANKKFLAVSNENSGLCILCHTMNGWGSASHSTSLAEWNNGSPNPWPRTGTGIVGYNPTWDFGWTKVRQNGCENCHSPHSAGGTERLLNYADEEQNCYPCHNGNVSQNIPPKNIQNQFGYASRHDVAAHAGIHDPQIENRSPLVLAEHVECVDCHNPHASNSTTPPVEPGGVSGITWKVSGVDKNGVGIALPATVRFEYEICFKCHAESTTLFPYITRSINTSNTRIQVSTNNPSYHPVIDVGKHTNPLDVPSLPSLDTEAPINLSVSSVIYCTDCHSDQVVNGATLMSRGPHGSPYAPILRRQYLTTIGTVESSLSYYLCYRCHNYNSIILNQSFKADAMGKGGHSGHLRSPNANERMPCSVCHDPHGVQDASNGAGPTGGHTYLINFDSSIVFGTGGNAYPKYTDNGGHTGSCTLECHFPDMTVKTHVNTTYP
jgi:predicted CXXCH cytochrome family protein